MIRRVLVYITGMLSLLTGSLRAQAPVSRIDSFWVSDSVRVTIDRPSLLQKGKPLLLIFYALPNGNSTEWTMGKTIQPGDDWHFDIQHIRAQTAFIRTQLKGKNIVVIYLVNSLRSWPAWKKNHPGFRVLIPHMVDSLAGLFQSKHKEIYLNGHSGGGSFIFGYLAGVERIPGTIKRISFLDSDYGYDSSYYPEIRQWLKNVKGASLNVFAYNDSVALYNGKRVVSDTGGTWYRSHLLLRHLAADYQFAAASTDSLKIYKSRDKNIQFFFKHNVNRGIYHTQQVELNGFIHSVLCGTRKDELHYHYYGPRAYTRFIR